jgi:hypothetical protein
VITVPAADKVSRAKEEKMFYRDSNQRGGRGHRNMYYATGLPGWMRGRGGGGPCAQYLLTGQWPTPEMQNRTQDQVTEPKAQLAGLKSMAQLLQHQLAQVQASITELEKNT